MTALLTPPLLAPVPGLRPFRWTVAEFHRFGDLGAFRGKRVKLIRGVLLEQDMMNPPHAIAGEKTEEALRVAFGPGWRVRVQKPLALSLDTDPEPDIAVVRGSPAALVHPTTADLVVEIADTSLDADITEMAELDATAGIAEYWVLDLDGRRLLVFRDPVPLPAGLGATAYRTHLTFGPTDSVSPLAVPTATVRVADLLP
jgi:Uma2 family endonuclease